MGDITRDIRLTAGVQKVWEYITNPDNFPQYIYGYDGGKTLSPNKVGVGAQYDWYGKIGPIRLRSTEEITEWVEGKRVAYRGKMTGIEFNSSMAIQGSGEGGTILVVTISYRVPIFLGGAFIDSLVGKRMVQDYVDRSLKRLGEIFGTYREKISRP